MPFTDYNRVVYKKNPLEMVVCQLRFPPILNINEKQPSEFQERIRDKFPYYNITVERQQFFIPPDIKDFVPSVLRMEDSNNYCFSSADNTWHVNLTSTFLALSTSKYDRWEQFFEKLQTPLSALNEIYKPSFFERVGLRYIDRFNLSKLNLENVEWSDLLQSFILGWLANQEIRNDVRKQNSFVELDIGNEAIAQINITKGLVVDFKSSFPVFDDDGKSLIVDSDLYMLRKDVGELYESLDYLHKNSTNLIRAIITDKLHKAMEPDEI
jgi:uncharacterized protein (TIGR04255 family)